MGQRKKLVLGTFITVILLTIIVIAGFVLAFILFAQQLAINPLGAKEPMDASAKQTAVGLAHGSPHMKPDPNSYVYSTKP